MIRRGILSPQTNRGKVTGDKTVGTNIKWDSLPWVSSMRDFSYRFATCLTSDGRSQSRQIQLDETRTEGAPTIRITTTPLNNARVCITWWRNSSRSGTLSNMFAQPVGKEKRHQRHSSKPLHLWQLATPRFFINYIHKGSINEKYSLGDKGEDCLALLL